MESRYPTHAEEQERGMDGAPNFIGVRLTSWLRFAWCKNRLLVVMIVVVMVMVVMMMMGMIYHHHLRLRPIRYSEAEEEKRSKQILFHALGWRFARRITELF